MSRLAFLCLLLLGLTGCPSSNDDDSAAGDDDDSTEEATTGTLAVSFRIDDDWAGNMDEPAIGAFRGSVWNADEVSGIGPDDGAVALADVYVEVVDLTGDDFSSGVLHVTGELPAMWVTILGFLDSDANATEDPYRPDEGDPVTLPNDNEFLVVAGEETPAEVLFDFLNP